MVELFVRLSLTVLSVLSFTEVVLFPDVVAKVEVSVDVDDWVLVGFKLLADKKLTKMKSRRLMCMYAFMLAATVQMSE